MAWGFGTWDANGVDNNTGLVKINALATWRIGSSQTGSRSFSLPSGYTLDYLFQPTGTALVDGRRKITSSGNTLTISAVGAGDYSDGTIPNYEGVVLAYAR